MSKVIRVALGIEASIRKEMERLLEISPPELAPALTMVANFHSKIELLLDKSYCVDCNLQGAPTVDLDDLIENDARWQDAFKTYAAASGKSSTNLTVLWNICSMVEHSAQYYHQAAMNSPYPNTRLFFNSIYEAKNAMRRRINGMLRIMYNEVWEEVGFAPFTLGKE